MAAPWRGPSASPRRQGRLVLSTSCRRTWPAVSAGHLSSNRSQQHTATVDLSRRKHCEPSARAAHAPPFRAAVRAARSKPSMGSTCCCASQQCILSPSCSAVRAAACNPLSLLLRLAGVAGLRASHVTCLSALWSDSSALEDEVARSWTGGAFSGKAWCKGRSSEARRPYGFRAASTPTPMSPFLQYEQLRD